MLKVCPEIRALARIKDRISGLQAEAKMDAEQVQEVMERFKSQLGSMPKAT